MLTHHEAFTCRKIYVKRIVSSGPVIGSVHIRILIRLLVLPVNLGNSTSPDLRIVDTASHDDRHTLRQHSDILLIDCTLYTEFTGFYDLNKGRVSGIVIASLRLGIPYGLDDSGDLARDR